MLEGNEGYRAIQMRFVYCHEENLTNFEACAPYHKIYYLKEYLSTVAITLETKVNLNDPENPIGKTYKIYNL